MNRRYFLHYSVVTAAFLFSGCNEKESKESDSKIITNSIKDTEQKSTKNQYFIQKLRLPKELDFSKLNTTEFIAQNSQVNIFPNVKTNVLTFQGNLPNPTIRIENGQQFDLTFKNELRKSTIVHWHGLIVPEEMDGHPKDAIANGQVKHYHYTVNQSAGTFWCHTHPHGRTGEEIYYGLSGFYIIEDKQEKALNLPRGEFEIPLMIQDRRIDKNGQLIYKDKKILQDNNGVLGDIILVNATPFPYHEIKNGKYRLRILNGSSVRTYKLAFDNIKEFMLIGTDAGLLEEPITVNSIVLSVAQRIDIIVDFSSKEIGDVITLKTLGFKEGSNMALHPDYPPFEAKMDIMQFKVIDHIDDKSIIPQKLIPIKRMKESDAVNTRKITMEIINGGIWTLNKKPYDMNRIDQRVKLNTIEIWEIKNTVHMAHPFHMHGVRFQVLDRDGSMEFPADNGWIDTVLVMPLETVRIIVHFTMPGLFVYHCHILEHEDDSMMANFLVE